MKEKENKKGMEEQTHERAFWIIGIAIIIFLILLGGSLIGMKMIRDKANYVGEVVDKAGEISNNYVVTESGVKQVTNPAITELEVEVEGRKFHNFSIEVSEEGSNISADVTNMTEEKLPQSSFTFELYDGQGNMIIAYLIGITEAEPGKTTSILSSVLVDCLNVERIEVSFVK